MQQPCRINNFEFVIKLYSLFFTDASNNKEATAAVSVAIVAAVVGSISVVTVFVVVLGYLKRRRQLSYEKYKEPPGMICYTTGTYAALTQVYQSSLCMHGCVIHDLCDITSSSTDFQITLQGLHVIKHLEAGCALLYNIIIR